MKLNWSIEIDRYTGNFMSIYDADAVLIIREFLFVIKINSQKVDAFFCSGQ